MRLAGKIEKQPEFFDSSADIEVLEFLKRAREVVKVSPLITLRQGTQLGRQHLFAGTRRDDRLARASRIVDLERQRRRAESAVGDILGHRWRSRLQTGKRCVQDLGVIHCQPHRQGQDTLAG